MQSSRSPDKPIGAVFTPLKWAKWVVQTFGVVEKWLSGASVCDPTAGEGAFAFALIDLAESMGAIVDDTLLNRLYLIEREACFVEAFKERFRRRYAREFPAGNIFCADVILNCPSIRADVLIGNPPWVNFPDLDHDYKEAIKPFFLEYGLIQDTQGLLLGSSRVDLSALIVAKALESLLTEGGEAIFFIPLSLFLNDGAHAGFRRMRFKMSSFSVSDIYDFGNESVFDAISTRFGVARICCDTQPRFPVPYRMRQNELWVGKYAAPLHGDTSPLSILDSKESWLALKQFEPISIQKHQIPRQGVNTCGANDVFVFDQYPAFLPDEFVFPLASKECFENPTLQPKRFILVPHDVKSGKPLSETSLKQYPDLWEYLNRHRDVLISRRGTMINTWIKRNQWWACLGVGPYSFTPYKLIWEALGKKKF